MKVYPSVEGYRSDIDKALKFGFHQPIMIQHHIDYQKETYDKSLKEYGMVWAQYKLQQMPGCCGLAVSFNAEINEYVRQYGLGEYFHEERLNLCKDSGYSCMIATTTDKNVIQQNLFQKKGWIMVHSFINKRTKNTVEIWVKDLN